MTPQQLRNSILQLAIEGKLVEQRPEEGTGEELYQLIQEEKQELIKIGKLKRQKNLPEITEEEIPFEIPNTWKWVRLSECLDVRDGTHDTPHYIEKGIPLVTSKNLVNGKIDFSTCKKISLEDHLKFSLRSNVDINDILFAMIGSIGNPVLVSNENRFSIKNMALFKNTYKNINMNYLYWFLYYSQRSMKIKASGGVQSFVSLTFLREFLFPLPPIEEQMRIVQKIEAISPIIDRYENTWHKLNELNKKFLEKIQKSILQEAIKGKLCEQKDEDGSAQDLIEKILLEKERLIEAGQIKKQKALPAIREDEIPFDIPSNWKWCYLGDLFSHVAGKALNAKNTKGRKYKYLTTSNVYWDYFELSNLKEMYYTEDEIKKYSVKYGDLLVLEGGDVGRSAIWNLKESYCIQNHIHRLRPYININVKYFYYVMMYFKYTGNILGRGIGIKGLSAKALHCIKVPLPPIDEQSRIIEKVNKVLELINRYKKILKINHTV